jgi:hypothetical protein
MYPRVGFAAIVALIFAALVPAARAAVPDGGLVRLPDGRVFRIVGGAPLYISTCAYTNGCSGVVNVANLDEYQQYPRDGAIVSGGSDGGIYRFAGGTPLWLSRCNYGAGCDPWIQIDDASYADRDHIRLQPADSTVIRNVDDGGYYRFAGGAPLLVRCDIGPGCVNPQQFDGGTFGRLGSISPGRSNWRSYPADGTTVTNADDGSYVRFAGGAPLPVGPCGSCGAVLVDSRTFALAGTATPSQPHMLAAPVDGTFVNAGSSYYRVAGGAFVALADCAPLGGCPGSVAVDPGTIAGLGGGRLRAMPQDGTVLRGLPSKQLWEIVNGHRRQTFINVTGIDVDDGAIAAIPLEAVVQPGPPVVPAPVPALFSPTLSSAYKVNGTRVRFSSLRVRDVPVGATVVIACHGRGCPFKTKRYKARNGRVDATPDFRHAKLANKAFMTVTVTAASGARKVLTFRFRGGKLPVRTLRCAPPGGKPKTC